MPFDINNHLLKHLSYRNKPQNQNELTAVYVKLIVSTPKEETLKYLLSEQFVNVYGINIITYYAVTEFIFMKMMYY